MFKCKECGTEYQTKPDYCDCGNDTFEEIVLEQPKSDKPTTIETKQDIIASTSTEMPQETIKATVKKTSAIEPYAIIIFSICILLSLIVILFVANPKPQNEIEDKEVQKTETTNIPSIENLWNNSTEGISAYQNTSNTTTEQPQQTTENNSKKKDEVIKQPVQQVQNTQPPITKPTPQAQVKKSQPVVKTNTNTNKTSMTAPKANPQELANYKIKLRNHIASKIAFTTIVGDGECSFSFKISSSGVLTNKAPTKLSDNDSLNEAVYNALRQVYSYNAPPSGYKNETLKLIVKMYHNNFEVYLN
ncbi:hypothetical protein IKE67_09905 [bacterium]|nr:hypothetical protein [bacterium]